MREFNDLDNFASSLGPRRGLKGESARQGEKRHLLTDAMWQSLAQKQSKGLTDENPERLQRELKNHLLMRDSWRLFRIMSEFVEGFESMTEVGPSVAIFGSARLNEHTHYYNLAVEVAKAIGEKGFSIITGGGPGIMEAANKGAQSADARSCGVSIELPFEDTFNRYVDPDFALSFRYFFIRKVLFIRYAQGFVALPGGMGTLDELFEAMTLIQTEKIQKFPIFLMGKDYWSGLLEWMRSVPLKEGCIDQSDLDRCILTDDPEFVADSLFQHAKDHFSMANF